MVPCHSPMAPALGETQDNNNERTMTDGGRSSQSNTSIPHHIVPQHQQQQSHIRYDYPLHPQVIPPVAPPSLYQAPQAMIGGDSETPQVFRNTKLRRGKWTHDEEMYAAHLIKEFEQGTITGIENGCTLRAFLSKKLHCAPMRISKKYAGKSIGKHVFLSRKPANGIPILQGLSNNTENLEKGQELESTFYQSLFEENRNESGGNQARFPPILMRPYQQAPPQNMYNRNVTYPPGGYSPFGAAPSTQFMVPTSEPNNNVVWQPPVNAAHAPKPHTAGNNHVAGEVSQLHQTYLNALKQMNLTPANVAAMAASAPQQGSPQTIPHNTMQTQPTLNPPLVASTNIATTPHCTGGPQLPMGVRVVAGNKQDNGKRMYQKHMQNEIIQQEANVTTMKEHQHAPPVNSAQGGPVLHPTQPLVNPMDTHDFLSGFEKMITGQGKTNLDCLLAEPQPSPTFTSQSFDDLHQFLGKGDFYQDAGASGESGATEAASDGAEAVLCWEDQLRGMPFPPIDNTRVDPCVGAFKSVTADAYAMFAQQSAFAVSQHSAYCRNNAMQPRTMYIQSAAVSHPEPLGTKNSPALIADDQSRNSPTSVAVESPSSCKVVNAANLRAHAKAEEQTSDSEPTTSKSELQTYMRSHTNIVSSSEQTNSDVGTEESLSGLGSLRGGSGSESNDPSDSTSNDSDSNSDDGPVRKKVKMACHEDVNGTALSLHRQELLPVLENNLMPEVQ